MAETSPGRLSRFARVMHPAFHSPAAVQHAEHMRHGEGQLALAVSDGRFSVVVGLPGRAGSMPARRRWGASLTWPLLRVTLRYPGPTVAPARGQSPWIRR